MTKTFGLLSTLYHIIQIIQIKLTSEYVEKVDMIELKNNCFCISEIFLFSPLQFLLKQTYLSLAYK